MSVASVVTGGYGSFGSVHLVVTGGYAIGAAAAEQPAVQPVVSSGSLRGRMRYVRVDADDEPRIYVVRGRAQRLHLVPGVTSLVLVRRHAGRATDLVLRAGHASLTRIGTPRLTLTTGHTTFAATRIITGKPAFLWLRPRTGTLTHTTMTTRLASLEAQMARIERNARALEMLMVA